MSVRAVLLVPEEGDPHGLLKEGPCGARPPMALLQAADMHEAVTPDVCFVCEREDLAGDGGCEAEGQRVLTQQCSWCGEPWPCTDAGTEAHPARWRSVAWLKGRLPIPKGEALVLAWDGVSLTDGIFRVPGDWEELSIAVSFAVSGVDPPRVYEMTEDYGTIVEIDAEGREVAT